MSTERLERLHDPNIQATAGALVGIFLAIPVLLIEVILKLVFSYMHIPVVLGYILHSLNGLFLFFVFLVNLLSFRRKPGNKGVTIGKSLCLLLILIITPLIWFQF